MKCEECRFLSKFTNDEGVWMNVCTTEDPEEEEAGLLKVAVIDTEYFDASCCRGFKKKK